jgi:microcystin-dependent protein
MAVTPRLGLSQPVGTDALSSVDNLINADNDILDNGALIFSGLFSARGTAASRGALNFYYATDTFSLHMSTGSVWIDVSPGPGAAPIGSMQDYAGATDPADTRWVIADGRALSTTTHAALFALVGSTYDTMAGQAAPGAGLFRIPKMAGRTTIAPGTATGAAGATAHTLGQVSGEETHLLLSSESGLPAHAHPMAAAYAVEAQVPADANGGGGIQWVARWLNGVSVTATNNNTAANAGAAHNNMQPYVAVNKLIRIL